jgi:hypothetical protein
MHEFAVRKTGFARGCADSYNPQRAEIAFLALAACVGELQGALNSFLRGTVQLAFG